MESKWLTVALDPWLSMGVLVDRDVVTLFSPHEIVVLCSQTFYHFKSPLTLPT